MLRDGSRALFSRDTDPATEKLQIALWRRMSPSGRLRGAVGASNGALRLCLAGVRMRHPGAEDGTLFLAYARIRLGAGIAAHLYRAPVLRDFEQGGTMDLVDVALLVASALDRTGLRYVVGGSLASSVSGEPRSTLDVDVMVEMTEHDVPALLANLGDDFHRDPQGFTRAIRSYSSVQIFHLPTATKVDLFVMGATAVEPEQMERRIRIDVPDRPGRQLYIYTAEDILLQKLRWYRLGREVSDRQWRDVLAIIAVQRDALDQTYLRRAASQLGLSGLLERALREVT